MKYINLTKRKLMKLLIVLLITSAILTSLYNYDLSSKYKNFKVLLTDSTNNFNYQKFSQISNEFKNGSIINDLFDKVIDNNYDESKYLINPNKDRLNELFKILKDKENLYENILRDLDLLMFSDVLSKNKVNSKVYKKFQTQIDDYFDIAFDEVVVRDKFINDLKYMSNYYSFLNPRRNVRPGPLNSDNKPVIVTASNIAYFGSLQATVYLIHENFPDYRLIIYDLGLGAENLKKTKEKCRCEVRQFDANKKYSTVSPHVLDLKKYAWKPLIIQEVLKDYDRVLYVDSSIRLHESVIAPIMKVVPITGLLTQFIGLKLTCYTNPKMFHWFHETKEFYQNLDTIEANILLMYRNFLNTIMMKAWVTCALDKNCIAPPGSTTSGCCGCHRYDQDAITIISTYFYGHPATQNNLPAHAFTKEESYFFKVERYNSRSYF